MKGVQCYEFFRGLALKNNTSFMCEKNIKDICSCVHAYMQIGACITLFAYACVYMCENVYVYACNIWIMLVCGCINACTYKYICV